MAKKLSWHLNGESEASALNKKEVTSIFFDTLNDIYAVKSHLLNYLPIITEKATAITLKLAILDTTIDIKAQMLSLDMVRVILNKELDLKPNIKQNDFSLNSYLKSSLDNTNPYETDVALLTHLIMIESIQVTTFTIMKQMSHAFNNKAIRDLIKQNLNDATENQLIFNAIMLDALAKPDH